MPQVLHVVHCYQCDFFQVKIVTKVQKWTCSRCGNPQSLKEEYFSGSGKECRAFVQEMNYKMGKMTEQMLAPESIQNIDVDMNECPPSNSENKWEKYLDKPVTKKQEKNPEIDSQYTFEQTSKKQKRTGIKNSDTHDYNSKDDLKNELKSDEENTRKNYGKQSKKENTEPSPNLCTSN